MSGAAACAPHRASPALVELSSNWNTINKTKAPAAKVATATTDSTGRQDLEHHASTSCDRKLGNALLEHYGVFGATSGLWCA
eukprot:CAMPEP_0206543170 /NCGR_PEP_ID=MMETSP0325_2-20121206/10668_1 /ASSEMBLY_ACC=CAM_ASM_000347 /TAXON_ID=2866 /ORGANISM="Crypthecodinium cohnii, Strain Seligo" /LENGTH=81 /DNA_ID=CAMNT_0054041487 /DNA_START=384 /DNA_END=629 /DNA_ORIENTATION=+